MKEYVLTFDQSSPYAAYTQFNNLKAYLTTGNIEYKFRWKDTGRYYPGFILIDEETAIVLKLLSV